MIAHRDPRSRANTIAWARLRTPSLSNSNVSNVLAGLCQGEQVRLLHTRRDIPRTNGKAERFIQTAFREWAFRIPHQSSQPRFEAPPRQFHFHNHHRQHTALG